MLTAEPGSGKTTLVPLLLLDEPWLAGRKILMLEPRRPAARMAARRMAALLGEEVGDTVGYQVRFERRMSAETRIEVLTEGLLLRRLQADPELQGVGLLIFDEFHERNLQADLSLALSLDVPSGLRDDLRLLVMSASLDPRPLVSMMPATAINAAGRRLSGRRRYAEQDAELRDLSRPACRAASAAVLADERRRPGVPSGPPRDRADARRGRGAIGVRQLDAQTLYGDMPAEAQDAVLLGGGITPPGDHGDRYRRDQPDHRGGGCGGRQRPGAQAGI